MNGIHNIVEHKLEYAVPARAIRFYPMKYKQSGCLRVEIYGYYIPKGICPDMQNKVKRQTCKGNKKCPNENASCQLDKGLYTLYIVKSLKSFVQFGCINHFIAIQETRTFYITPGIFIKTDLAPLIKHDIYRLFFHYLKPVKLCL